MTNFGHSLIVSTAMAINKLAVLLCKKRLQLQSGSRTFNFNSNSFTILLQWHGMTWHGTLLLFREEKRMFCSYCYSLPLPIQSTVRCGRR